MIPIIPFLAWTGGIAAGAQVVGGVVRGVGQLVRGHPGKAIVEVASGVVAPVRTACEQLGKLGGDVYTAVVGATSPSPAAAPVPPAMPPRPRWPRRQRRNQSPNLAPANPNGALVVVNDS